MVDSRCGLHCTGCGWITSHGCGGCLETNGHPFHGECPIAVCAQNKGLAHCGECDIIPCDQLMAYSYLDLEHGDKPQGARVQVCRRWAAESGKQTWSHVLLTSAGFEDINDQPKPEIINRFLQMLDKPVQEARVLFIPTAVIDEEAKKMVGCCKRELLNLGIQPQSIVEYDIDGRLTLDEAMSCDVIYFTGGNTHHLMQRIKETHFDEIIKKMVYAGKVYVGVSAGSLIATPNIGEPSNPDTTGLALVNAYLSVHQPSGAQSRTDLPLPHLPLTDNQALTVSWAGYELIEG